MNAEVKVTHLKRLGNCRASVRRAELGSTQIAVSFSVNLLIALSAAGIASWFSRNPTWLATQRYFMGFVLGALAARLAFE